MIIQNKSVILTKEEFEKIFQRLDNKTVGYLFAPDTPTAKEWLHYDRENLLLAVYRSFNTYNRTF